MGEDLNEKQLLALLMPVCLKIVISTSLAGLSGMPVISALQR